MTWHAKPPAGQSPAGGYSITSAEARDNILEAEQILLSEGWTAAAIAGAMGNSAHEGVFNPWNWQSSTVSQTGGCGLFGFTPASRYLTYPGSDQMNRSATSITSGASPDVGAQQVRLMSSGTWGWPATTLWRSYWDAAANPDLYAYRNEVLRKWGVNGHVTLNTYKNITDVRDATFAFYAAFEGPQTATMSRFNQRADDAQYIYDNILSGGGDDDLAASILIFFMTKLFKL